MRLSRCIAFGLAVILAVGCGSRQEERPKPDPPNPDAEMKIVDGPGLLWEVSSPTTTIYLVGSIHVGKKGCFPLPAEVEDAFAKCPILVVELEPGPANEAKATQLVLAHGAYPHGQSLSQHLSKETRELLDNHLKGKGLPTGTFDRLRPWTVSLVLSVQELVA